MKKYSLMLVIVADWAHSITDPTSKNWYMTPVEGKVVK